MRGSGVAVLATNLLTVGLLTVSLLMVSAAAGNAYAAETGPLAPGKPAGAAAAQADNTTFYVIAASALLVAGFSFLISTDHGSNNPTAISGGSPFTAVGSNAPAPTGTQ